MKKNLIISFLIIFMLIIDIILIQEFLSQHNEETKKETIQVENKIEQPTKTTEKKEVDEIKHEEIAYHIEEHVKKTVNQLPIEEKKLRDEPSNIPNFENLPEIELEKGSSGEFIPVKAVSKVWLNLRAEPRLDANVLTVIKKGDQVTIIDKKFNHWKKVIYKTKDKELIGWVDDRYLQVIDTTQESAESDSEKPPDQ
ncbi:SH3 domain-containing protein [Persephonella sp.]